MKNLILATHCVIRRTMWKSKMSLRDMFAWVCSKPFKLVFQKNTMLLFVLFCSKVLINACVNFEKTSIGICFLPLLAAPSFFCGLKSRFILDQTYRTLWQRETAILSPLLFIVGGKQKCTAASQIHICKKYLLTHIPPTQEICRSGTDPWGHAIFPNNAGNCAIRSHP